MKVDPFTLTLSPLDGERGQRPSVGSLLSQGCDQLQAAGADSPWLTALVLLERAAGMQRPTLLAHPEMALTPNQVDQFRALLKRRCTREPLAYILGYRDFYGRRFAVSPATLIPRPETEGLVDLAIERLDRLPSGPRFPLLDVGTGSGAIVVSILAERPEIAAIATDSSIEALAVTRDNACAHGVDDRLRVVACDLGSALDARFPVVVANLPYISSADLDALEPEVSEYEPRSALDGGLDGTVVIRRFLVSLMGLLAPGGVALLEIGDRHADELCGFTPEILPTCSVYVARDRAGADRFLIVESGGR